MKDCMHDEKGVIYVGIIFISLIIFVLSTSLLNILLNNNMIISSNNDNYRAGYIVESILELKIEEIMELCNQATDDYLADLQTYNMEYIETVDLQAYDMVYTEVTDNNILCGPSDFCNYMADLVSDIEDLSGWENNPFEEYRERHYYKVDIKCDLSKNCINITSRGEYRQARKFINVDLELPEIINDGDDNSDLPGTVISPVKVIRYYQTVGL
ncbi:MAG: hypothetical protein ACOX0L_03480 [Natronincolaceae bacterium]|jgi:hypothetical protein